MFHYCSGAGLCWRCIKKKRILDEFEKKGLIVLINMIAGLLLNVICIILKCLLLFNVDTVDS